MTDINYNDTNLHMQIREFGKHTTKAILKQSLKKLYKIIHLIPKSNNITFYRKLLKSILN